AGMIVRLDLEHSGEAFTDVDGTGVLARSLQDMLPFSRKVSQDGSGVFIAAMLTPHRAEHTQLNWRRLSAEQLDNPRILIMCQSNFVKNLGSYLHSPLRSLNVDDP